METAPLVQAYGRNSWAAGTLATLDAILMILPFFCFTISGAMALQTPHVPLTFTTNILSHWSTVQASQGWALTPYHIAALLMRISTLPYCFITPSAIFLPASSCEISASTIAPSP